MFQIIREPEFAKRVSDCRRALDKRQSQCAREMRVSRQMWNNWEIGYCKPKGRKLKRMAQVLKCDPYWLVHGGKSELETRMQRANLLIRKAQIDPQLIEHQDELKPQLQSSMLMLRSATRELSHISNAIGNKL